MFAAPLFAFHLDAGVWLRAGGALIAFCLASSSIYLLNDSIDVSADRSHPSKRNRPIAAGLVSVPIALSLSVLLAFISLTLSAAISKLLAAVILTYIVIQLSYCLHLKREPIIDLFCISAGFLLRASAGGVAGRLSLSPWFLLTVALLALFLAIEKRKAELQVGLDSGVITRQVLARYSLPLLLRLEGLVSTSAFMSYSLWAAGPSLGGASTSWMLITVPFVLVGIFRYQLLSDPEETKRRSSLFPDQTSEKPEEILLGDRGIKMTLLGWLLTTMAIGVFGSIR